MVRARSPTRPRAAARAHGPAPRRPELPRRPGAAAPSSTPALPRACRTAGDLALISQSGAIAAGLVEWAAQRDGRLLGGGLARRPDRCRFRRSARLSSRSTAATRAILLYIEVDQRRAQVHVGGARRGARQAGRRHQVRPARARRARGAQPIPERSPAPMPFMTPRSAAPACCACSISTNCSRRPRHSGTCRPFSGNRLAILTNGGGIGVLAVDRLSISAARSRRFRRRP